MAVATEVTNVRYPGNNSTSIEYPVTFPVVDGSHIKVGVRPDGEAFAELPSWKFVVVPKAGGAFAVTTVDAIAVDSVVVIWREVPVTQPTELPLAGRLPSTAIEGGLDRATMQIQELKATQARCIKLDQAADEQDDIAPVPNTLLGFDGDGNFTTLDSTTVRELAQLDGDGANATASWANAAAQAAVVPGFIGQLGVRRDDLSVWVAQNIAAGAWARARGDIGGKVIVTNETQFAAALAAGLGIRVVGEIELTTHYDITTATVIEGAQGAAITLAGADTYGFSVQASLIVRDIKIKAPTRLQKRAFAIGGTRYAGYFVLQNVEFDTIGNALCADGGATSPIMPDILIDQCRFKRIGGNGYTGGSIGNSGAVVINWNLGSVRIQGCEFDDIYGNPIHVSYNGIKTIPPDADDNSSVVNEFEEEGCVWVIGNRMRNYDRNGIECFSCDYGHIVLNQVIGGSGSWVGGGSGIGISAAGKYMKVHLNSVKNFWGYGIEIYGYGITCTDNTIDTCSQDSANIRRGLSVDHSSHCLVSGNQFINIVNAVNPKTAIGVSNSNNITIDGNRFSLVSIACDVQAASCENITFTGNEHFFSDGGSGLGNSYKWTFAATSGLKHIVIGNITRNIGAVPAAQFLKVAATFGVYYDYTTGQHVAPGPGFLEFGTLGQNLVIP